MLEWRNHSESPREEKAVALTRKGDECNRSSDDGICSVGRVHNSSGLDNCRGRLEKGGVWLERIGGGRRKPRVGGVEDKSGGAVGGVAEKSIGLCDIGAAYCMGVDVLL